LSFSIVKYLSIAKTKATSKGAIKEL